MYNNNINRKEWTELKKSFNEFQQQELKRSQEIQKVVNEFYNLMSIVPEEWHFDNEE